MNKDTDANSSNIEGGQLFDKETPPSKKTGGYIFLFIINILILLTSPILLFIGGLLRTSPNETENVIGVIVIISAIFLTIAQVINIRKSYKDYEKTPDKSVLRMVIPLIVLLLLAFLYSLVSG